MRRLALLLLALPAAPAWSCDVAAYLVKTWGISFAGFERPIMPAPQNLPSSWNQADVLTIFLNSNPDLIKDGFEHRALVNPRLKQAMILRTGGFGGVHEWYGPVQLMAVDLAGCEPVSRPAPVSPAPVCRERSPSDVGAGQPECGRPEEDLSPP